MAIIFCNVGWMEYYQGLQGGGDQIVGGGAYVEEEGRGFETCNFAPQDNSLYGHVQPPGGTRINIERIGANADDDSIDGVTVIWTARHPRGGTVVVGWFKNATVFRNYERFQNPPEAQKQDGIDGYWISAPFDEAHLLPIDERTRNIPRGVVGGMGMSNIWYAKRPESADIVRTVLDLVGGIRAMPVAADGRAGQDQDRKAEIEKSAIQLCCQYFEGLGYSVERGMLCSCCEYRLIYYV